MNSVYGLTTENLLRTLPEVLKNDESMYALAASVAEVLAGRPKEIETLMIYNRIDQLPEPLLDILAHDFKVDWWDAGCTLEEKRRILKDSWHVRKTLGTRYAVKTAISAIYRDTVLQEWWEYGGKPYMFKVLLDIQSHGADTGIYAKMHKSINIYKSLRSHLEAMVGIFHVESPVPMRLTAWAISMRWGHAVFGFGDWLYFDGRHRFSGSRRMNGLGSSAVIMRGSSIPGVGIRSAFPTAPHSSTTIAVTEQIRCPPTARFQFASDGTMPVTQRIAPNRLTVRAKTHVKQKTPGVVVQDTMSRMDGTYRMDGTRRFNAAVIRSEV